MKKILVFTLSLIVFLILPIQVKAADSITKYTQTGQTVTIEESETIDNDYYIGGETIKVFGTINGDLYAAGGTIIISGNVNGDLLVAGGNIDISGKVSENVRAAGGQINIDGDVGRNITLIGGNLYLGSNSKIAGSVTAAGGNLNIDSEIPKDLIAAVGNLTISNTIGGDVEVKSDQTTLTNNASIKGNFDYWSNNNATIADGATVSGKTVKNTPKTNVNLKGRTPSAQNFNRIRRGITETFKFYSFITTLIVGLILIKLFPKFCLGVADKIKEKPFSDFLIGFAGVILLPILFFLIAITIIGLPISFISFALYLIFIYVSKIFIFIWGGSLILKNINKEQNTYWAFVIGLIVYSVLTLIPIFSFLLRILVLFTGFGALLISCSNWYKKSAKTL